MLNQLQCFKCVMDKSAPEITFDRNGVCNFCHLAQSQLYKLSDNREDFYATLEKIKEAGKGKKYDVLLGLSGGIDSAAALEHCIARSLRPLCFSVDNGWNEPIADENIMRIVEGMNAEQKAEGSDIRVPFFKYNIDCNIFKKLQSAFIRSGVINVEIPSDHIIVATAYEMAAKYGIKYIISGGNLATESIMPYSWSYPARDLRHIKAIYKKFVGKPLKGLPVMSLLKFNYYRWIKQIKVVNILDYAHYNREASIKDFNKRFGYIDYGEKHGESTFTKWFQNWYLFEKFGIDKRKAHYSSLINSNQMTREEALFKLEASPIYPEFGMEKKILIYPKHDHHDYPTNERLYNFICKMVKLFI